MALQYELAGSQIDGARDYQEDAFLITHMTDGDGDPASLIVIADGMGGHAAGNVASNMAVQAINKHVNSGYPANNPADILHECVIKANTSIKETVAETPALSGMGCTMVAAIIEKGKLWWASVGDSHLYLLRDKELKKINADHSYGGFLDRMAAAGTPVEAEPGLSRNMLMSAVTGDEINEIDVSQEPLELQTGDRLILCSDGMDTLSTGKIIQFCEWSETPKECVEALLNAVEDAAMPKQDNTTVVTVYVSEKVRESVSAPAEDSPAVTAETAPVAETPSPAGLAPASPAAPHGAQSGQKTRLLLILAATVAIAAIAAYLLVSRDRDTMPVTDREDPGVTGEAPGEQAVLPEEDQEEISDIPAAVKEPVVEQAPPVTTTDPEVAPYSPGYEFQDVLKDGTPGPDMIVIPEGTFEMGSPGTSRNADERPRHTVRVSRFAISKYEITFAEYEKFVRATGRDIPDNLYMDKATHPVIFVSWDDAFYYTRWLSEQTGENYHLPTESQWEYAAGAGSRAPFWWGYAEEPNRAHCFGCGTGLDPRKPTRVGSFEPNPFGVYDTAGNVAEWVRDCWHDNYVNAPQDDSVWEGGDCSVRVVRGGSYNSPPQSIRHTKRDKLRSNTVYDNIGIRVVREME